MRIGIIGAGHMGGALAKRLAAAGHEIVISNSRGPDTLLDTVAGLGPLVLAATTPEVVEAGEVVILAVPYGRIDEVAAASAAWRGKIVVDVTNFFPQRDVGTLDPGYHGSSVEVARKLPGARVVKAFNTIGARRLDRELRLVGSEPDAVFYAGDDAEAEQIVAQIIRDAGCAPVRTGPLFEGGVRQQPGSDIYGYPLSRAEAEERLSRAV